MSAFPLYIHIPFCKKKCGYCDFFSLPVGNEEASKKQITNRYIKALVNQIHAFTVVFNVTEWSSVYIGGGTPSLLSEEDLSFLCENIHSAAPISDGCEWTMEMNPGTITKSLLQTAQKGGVNRLSVGVQCRDDRVLRASGRIVTKEEIDAAFCLIKDYWKNEQGQPLSFSADLIAGLPFQTRENIKDDIDFVKKAGAGHISLYSLTVEEGTALQRGIDSGKIPYDADDADSLWLFGRDLLEKNGFFQYEVSNFSIPGFESAHNQAYWGLKSYIGCGAGATGTIYNNPTGYRWTWPQSVEGFIGDFEKAADFKNLIGFGGPPDFLKGIEWLDQKTQSFEYIMMGLRTLRGVCKEEYQERFKEDLSERLGESGGPLAQWQKKGLCAKRKEGGKTYYALTKEGLLFLNAFLEKIL